MVLAPLPFATGVSFLLVGSAAVITVTDPVLGLLAIVLLARRRGPGPAGRLADVPPHGAGAAPPGRVAGVAHESFDGALTVKALGREAAETARFRAVADDLADQTRRGRTRLDRLPGPDRGAARDRHRRRAGGRHRHDRRRRAQCGGTGPGDLPAVVAGRPDPPDRLPDVGRGAQRRRMAPGRRPSWRPTTRWPMAGPDPAHGPTGRRGGRPPGLRLRARPAGARRPQLDLAPGRTLAVVGPTGIGQVDAGVAAGTAVGPRRRHAAPRRPRPARARPRAWCPRGRLCRAGRVPVRRHGRRQRRAAPRPRPRAHPRGAAAGQRTRVRRRPARRSRHPAR